MQPANSMGECDDHLWDKTLSDAENEEAFIRQRRAEVMAAPRNLKHRAFVTGMEIMTRLAGLSLPQGKERQQFIRMYYVVMREFDDIADGDRPAPVGFCSPAETLEDAIAFTRAWQDGACPPPQHSLQHLLARCFDLAETFHTEFYGETMYILSSILFDARRRSQPDFFPKQDLDKAYDDMDVRGTVRGCLKAAHEDVSLEDEFRDLGRAARLQYTLRDFVEDNRNCLTNIPSEDAKRLGITQADLSLGIAHPGIRQWWDERVEEGQELLQRHERKIETLPIQHWITRLTLWAKYQQPAKRFFGEQARHHDAIRLEHPLHTSIRAPVNNLLTMMHAQFLSIMHRKALGIEPHEKKRYYEKTRNLALCYRGLSGSTSPRLSRKAAVAGYASCAYDVATDWRGFDGTSRTAFERILNAIVTPEAARLAMELYDRDKAGTLEHDGLERGSVALQFIAITMDIRQELEQKGIPIEELGEILQIADDILDLEKDEHDAQMNCILTPRRTQHLQRFLESDIQTLFPGTLLQQIILRAQAKARFLLHE